MPAYLPAVRYRARAAAAVLLLTALLASTAVTPVRSASSGAARGPHGMVVAPELHAAEVGRDVLHDGGNAVDAAVATALALAVTYPRAGNLGGGGFLLVRHADGSYDALDHRETAPAALDPGRFLGPDGRPDPARSRRGGLAVGVPGSVAGLHEAHRRWGTLPWRRLVAPAVRLAARGFPISTRTAETLAARTDDLAADPAARGIFTLDGRPVPPGHVLVQRDLARTLRRIASRGPAGFYGGPVAASVVSAVRTHGGVMSLDDLAGYRAVLRKPVDGAYRGHRVVSFPPPSSGGVVLLQMLAMLERFDVAASGPGASLTIHRMVEVERRAFSDRARWMGDPDHVRVPVAALLDAGYLAGRAATLVDDVATPSDQVRPWSEPIAEPTETMHLSVAAPDGSVVALTTTLNSFYGAAIVAPGTGVLLNNQVDDFALAAGLPNQWGAVTGDLNLVAGGRRPLSSMTPTIVESPEGGDRPFLVLGSPGGPTIITSVLQVLVNVIDHGMPLQEAVDSARFHHQWIPDVVQHERRAFPADVLDALRRRGHSLLERDRLLGSVSAIGVDEDGAWLGAADPRREGVARGF